ncbi:MAG: SoxR reducing system RseC family protein [Candidatus Omnitrophica bacterium]|nr:SoxR reducing system RseC family protein [Candidatus Omnitrophota bacterium]
MFKETVLVTEVENSRITVEFKKKQMCDCCRYSSVCGVEDTQQNSRREKIVIFNKDNLAIHPGDRVEVAIDERRSIIANSLIFLLPALIFVLFLAAFNRLGIVFSFFLAVLVVFVYYSLVKIILKSKSSYFDLKILRKV